MSRKLFALSEQQESPNQKITTMPNFLLFLATSIAITVAPGPDNLQVLARGISQGRAAGLVAALGFAAGITFHTTLFRSHLPPQAPAPLT